MMNKGLHCNIAPIPKVLQPNIRKKELWEDRVEILERQVSELQDIMRKIYEVVVEDDE